MIELYTELVVTGNESTLPRGIAQGSRIAAPSTCDFICDVELIANRELCVKDRGLFWLVYHDAKFKESRCEPDVVARIKELVGKQFISRRLYPTNKYFKGKPIR